MYGISLDIGTSGIRAHAVELSSGKILSTAMTESHPLPGANIMDHLTFCIRLGREIAHSILMGTVNQVIGELGIDLEKVERVAICGNPIQLSLFQNMYIDDLAYAGEQAWKSKGITPLKRNARVIPAVEVGLNVPKSAQLLVPPAIKHEIGADALAMLVKSGFLDQKENCLVTDYGTNAEMALKVGDNIYTGSAAAGPAMEGQHIEKGMLASPGAISDLEYDFNWRCKVLDENLIPVPGDLLNLTMGTVVEEGEMHGKAVGITGTGVVAALAAAMDDNIWKKGKLNVFEGKLKLQDGIYVTEHDISEAAKAIGAMRAGHFTLLEHAGIKFEDLKIMYMSGATGTYVDAEKARKIGLLPPTCNQIYQIGNTSLAMATDILRKPELLDELQTIADGIRSNHVMFATDKVFESIYIQELAYWDEGMPMAMYNANLEALGIQQLPKVRGRPEITRITERDIPVLGDKGLKIIKDFGTELIGIFAGCDRCGKCVRECPENAMVQEPNGTLRIKTKNCLGTACQRCQFACPKKVYKYEELKLTN
ncbi:MAG: methylamine methyltransferase corrinoid protein reductive activase [Methanomassiliicoccaceae archaeon]|jgi:methylamine methyltransferase corrinoid protein reductive activase|nr:methylamine methyltransferase corrinoid protein reductive activase [Methanomassiliicoccaceae archaeon]